MRPSLLALLVLAGCVASTPPQPSDPPAASAGEDRTVAGTVAAIDLEPMSYDGDGVVSVETDEGAVVRVSIPARQHLCAADFSGFDGVEVGDAVEVRGEAVADDAVRPCTSGDHYFRRR